MDGSALETSDGALLWGTVEGAGPPAVLCHGGPGLWDYFDALALELSDSLTVHRWDQRGCGRSEPSSGYGLDVAVRDVQDVKRAFGVRDPWVVLGHSWGAYLALLTALEHPGSTTALICISGTGSPSWWTDTGSPAYKTERARRMPVTSQRRLDELTYLERSWDEEIEFRRLSWRTDFVDQDPPPAALDAMASTPLGINWEINRKLSRASLDSEAELLEACERCEIPSLFLHGSEDPRPHDGARLLSGRIPNGQLISIPGAGHLPWIERPQETLAAITIFLDDVLA